MKAIWTVVVYLIASLGKSITAKNQVIYPYDERILTERNGEQQSKRSEYTKSISRINTRKKTPCNFVY